MTIEERLTRAFRALDRQHRASPEAWQAIQQGLARRRGKRLLARIGLAVAPLLAVGGIGVGASGVLAPAGSPTHVQVGPGPSTTPAPPPTSVRTTLTTTLPARTATTQSLPSQTPTTAAVSSSTTPAPTIPAPTTTTPLATTTVATTTTVPATTTTTSGVPLSAVSWSQVSFPDAAYCSPSAMTVLQVLDTAPAPGVQRAVVLTGCQANGTPPVGLYVYRPGPSATAPTLESTLIAPSDRWSQGRPVTGANPPLAASGSTVTLAVSGFSSSAPASSPACIPNLSTTLTWSWTAQGYGLTAPEPAHETTGPACWY